MTETIDVRRLAVEIRKKRENKGLRETAREIGGISASTLSRVEAGRIPDLASFLRLCQWLGFSPDEFTEGIADATPSAETVTTPDVVEAHLRADRELPPKTVQALSAAFRALYDAAKRGEI